MTMHVDFTSDVEEDIEGYVIEGNKYFRYKDFANYGGGQIPASLGTAPVYNLADMLPSAQIKLWVDDKLIIDWIASHFTGIRHRPGATNVAWLNDDARFILANWR